MEFDYKKFLTEGKLHKENEESNPIMGEDDYALVNADWKDFEGFIDELIQTLPQFGLFIEEDGAFEGSDQRGVVISKGPLKNTSYHKDLQDLNDDSMPDEEYNEEPNLNPGGGPYNPADNA